MIRWTLLLLPAATAFGQATDVDRNGCVDLADYAEVQRAFTGPECTDAPAGVEMVTVPGGGAGPAYTFEISKYEITNEQFVAFLNDAQLDGGLTRRGSYVVFGTDGRMKLLGGTLAFRADPASITPRIRYDAQDALGERYWVVAGFEDHPVQGATWFGAVKYCNWLSLASGLHAADICYAEGPSESYFHPITTTPNAWGTADLNDEQRTRLVEECRGFRLPMDRMGQATGYLSSQVNAFNEWYKAAAYDPSGPMVSRAGFYGETVPAFHWIHGYGRDTVAPGDANYWGNGDLFDNATTPVGWFDGVHWLAMNVAKSNPNGNRWGAYDFSGNVSEWVQDKGSYNEYRGVRGGNYSQGPIEMACALRSHFPSTDAAATLGFRVVRVP